MSTIESGARATTDAPAAEASADDKAPRNRESRLARVINRLTARPEPTLDEAEDFEFPEPTYSTYNDDPLDLTDYERQHPPEPTTAEIQALDDAIAASNAGRPPLPPLSQ